MGIDLFRPFPVPSSSNRCIIASIYHSTRNVETSSLPPCDGAKKCKLLTPSCTVKHGSTRSLISNRERLQRPKDLFFACNVIYHPTTSYHAYGVSLICTKLNSSGTPDSLSPRPRTGDTRQYPRAEGRRLRDKMNNSPGRRQYCANISVKSERLIRYNFAII